VSSSIGEARRVRIETQQGVAVRAPRRWPDSTPPPTISRRELASVAKDIQVLQRSWVQRGAKRGIDIVGSSIGLVLTLPIFVLVGVLIRLTSKGPAFFTQDRCGLGGRTFRFYKFRTMVADAEARKAELAHLNEMSGPVFKIARDPRITRVGAFLRKSSIDELPQLWNVLKGDMSLVGPRPPLPDEVARYDARQAQRLSVVPGITGLWQVSGRSSLPDFDNWLALDLAYAQRQSLGLDLQILLKTVLVVVTAKGAQ
jgi:lipopolysaccharide/colanic/teichoic acid biosynthesis glycosyltransferase